MKKTFQFITFLSLFVSNMSISAELIDTNLQGLTCRFEITDTPSILSCDGYSITVVCPSNNEIKTINYVIENPVCPNVVIDKYLYEPSSTVDIFHNLLFVVFQSENLSNCLTENGGKPSAEGSLALLANLETMGLRSMYVDTEKWTVVIKSTSGDLFCDGGVLYDFIFRSNFE